MEPRAFVQVREKVLNWGEGGPLASVWAGVPGGSGGRRAAEQPGQRRLSPAAERQAAGVRSWRVEPGDSGGDGRKGEWTACALSRVALPKPRSCAPTRSKRRKAWLFLSLWNLTVVALFPAPAPLPKVTPTALACASRSEV